MQKLIFLGLSFVVLLWCGFTAAQQAVSTTVPIAPWIELVNPYLFALASAVIPVCVAFVTNKLRERYNVQITAGQRDAFQTALLNTAGKIITDTGGALAGLSFDAKAPWLASYIAMVQKGAADMSATVSPQDIADRLAGKLGIIVGGVLPAETQGPGGIPATSPSTFGNRGV